LSRKAVIVGVQDILDLDRRTFELESKPDGWEAQLRDILADGFQIRRSDPRIPMQGREEMVDHVGRSALVERSIVSQRAWWDGDIAVVYSTVELADQPNQLYQNIKVFSRKAGPWRCYYWQVTQFQRPRS
jgi:hypothetical protein